MTFLQGVQWLIVPILLQLIHGVNKNLNDMFIGHQKHALILSIVWTFTFGAVIDQASIGAGDLNEDVFLGEDSDTSSSLEGGFHFR